ncbi:biotin--[acetyl-CoA-carboxylase] ligase [Qipengyuania sp.]|uniref:biotin--[acetyl-CoA-carboxylase] ligase n=1 Tax=Qipengyuania sp. TaxID=2004515 RepID=UPI003736BFA6
MIETVAETGSTNADLLARIAAGDDLREGHWLVADRQTAGRGRRGREWFDGRGNFMGSTIVRPVAGDPPAATLSLVTGLAVYEAVSTLVPPDASLLLKWPNDLVLKGAKLSGILLEQAIGVVVVGIGVNLARAPELPDRQTIALARFGPAPDRDLFAHNLAACMAEELVRWRTYGLELVIRRWSSVAHPIGTELAVAPPGEEPVRGQFAGLTAEGNLTLARADGERRIIHAGDVMLDYRGS